MPRSKKTMPRSKKTMLRSKTTMPRSKRTMPRSKKTMPRNKKAMPRSKKAMPRGKKATDSHIHPAIVQHFARRSSPEGSRPQTALQNIKNTSKFKKRKTKNNMFFAAAPRTVKLQWGVEEV